MCLDPQCERSSPHATWHPLTWFWEAEWMLSSSPRHHRWGWRTPPCHLHLPSLAIQLVSAHLSVSIPTLGLRAAYLFTFLTIRVRILYLFSFHVSTSDRNEGVRAALTQISQFLQNRLSKNTMSHLPQGVWGRILRCHQSVIVTSVLSSIPSSGILCF